MPDRTVQLRHGEWTALVGVRGAALSRLEVGERPVIQPALDAGPGGAHGAVLVPWPNRLGDGRYAFDGTTYELACTEPARGNAIHGLARDRTWTVEEADDASCRLGLTLGDDPGYPFAVAVTVAHRLDDHGLTVTTTATNLGDRPAPWGSGHHPYLSPGAGPIDDAVVALDAATRIVTDDRQLPIGREPVAGTSFDLRDPVRLGPRRIDHGYTDLARDADGRAWAHLTGTDGVTVALWADVAHPVLQVYTADHLGHGLRRGGLAVEPMTCPADAFRTGDHLTVLAPGATVDATWGLTVTRP